MIGHPDDDAFRLVPEKVFKTALFMNKIGSVRVKPEKWQGPVLHAFALTSGEAP